MANEIAIIRGDDRTLTLTVKDADGNAVNIADSEIRFTVKERWDDADSAAKITKKNGAASGSDSQIKITNGVGGLAEIYLVPTDTSSMDLGNNESVTYHYDVQVKLASGKTYTVVRSTIKIQTDITLAA